LSCTGSWTTAPVRPPARSSGESEPSVVYDYDFDAEQLNVTVGCFLKHQDDVERLRGGLGAELLEAVAAG